MTTDRTATLAKIDRALDMVSALCKPRGTVGAREWSMSIPANPERDPDLVIADALHDARRLLRGEASEGERCEQVSFGSSDLPHTLHFLAGGVVQVGDGYASMTLPRQVVDYLAGRLSQRPAAQPATVVESVVKQAGESAPAPEGDLRCASVRFGAQCWRQAGHDGDHRAGLRRWGTKTPAPAPVPESEWERIAAAVEHGLPYPDAGAVEAITRRVLAELDAQATLAMSRMRLRNYDRTLMLLQERGQLDGGALQDAWEDVIAALRRTPEPGGEG